MLLKAIVPEERLKKKKKKKKSAFSKQKEKVYKENSIKVINFPLLKVKNIQYAGILLYFK